MTTASLPAAKLQSSSEAPPDVRPQRIMSIDALRGFVMFTMIFVNDLAGADGDIVPNWMKHASDIRPRISSGMTFVDLVFPGFLFIVGLSIPFALGGRLARGERWYRILPHVLARTASLLLLGILMMNGQPDATKIPWYHAPSALAATTAPATASAKIDTTAHYGSCSCTPPRCSHSANSRRSGCRRRTPRPSGDGASSR